MQVRHGTRVLAVQRPRLPMNSEDPIEIGKRLNQLLRLDGRVDAKLQPDFQKRVWQRIVRAEAANGQPSFWRSVGFAIEHLFARTSAAYAYILLLLLTGLTAGWMQAREKSERLNAQLGHRYVQSVDPYQNPLH